METEIGIFTTDVLSDVTMLCGTNANLVLILLLSSCVMIMCVDFMGKHVNYERLSHKHVKCINWFNVWTFWRI